MPDSSTAQRGRSLITRTLSANRATAAFAFSAAAVAAVAQVVLPALTGRAIDVATGQVAGSVARIAWAMVGVALLTYAMSWVRRWSAGRLASQSQHWVRVGLLRTLQRLDGPGQDEIVTGQIVSRSISDLNQFHMVLATLPMFVTRALQLAVTLAAMFLMDVRLTLLSLALLPLILWEANRSRTALYAATWVNQQSAADLTAHVEQTVSGVRVVKAFGREERAIDELDRLSRDLYAVKMRAAKLTARFQPVLSQLPKIALVITIVAGGVTAIRGGISVGGFVAFTSYLTSMTSMMSMLTNQYVRLQMGRSSVDRLSEVLALRPRRAEPAHPASPPEGAAGLRFDGVDFSTGGHRVLDGFSLEVRPGEFLALVGPAGAGKSMAAQLAGGFYEPDGGSISLLDAHSSATDYSTLSTTAIRSVVTCVFDEAFLFSSSVRDNIALGAPGGTATDEQVAEAARLARADEFIERLPDGYDTLVGERGLTLSGGQRQRIALARALMARPAVLVLDDATSAIDAENEALILDNLRAHLRDVAVIAVAHRQSTVDRADRVAVVEGGRVVAAGPRSEIEADPAYRRVMAPHAAPTEPSRPTRAELWPDVARPERERIVLPTAGHGRAITATPKLRERVASLPPAREQPRIDAAALREPNRPFSVPALFRAVKWLIAATVALLIVGVLADLAFPTLVRAAIDRGIEPGDTATLWRVGGLALAVVAAAWASEALMTVLSSRAGERLLYGLRLRSYAHLQHLGLAYFERHLSGRIMTRMTTDIDTLSGFLQTGLAQAIVSAGTLVGVALMLVATDGGLTLVALAAVPLIAAATAVFRVLSKRWYQAARTQISAVNGEFAELIGGIRTTQMHRGERSAEDHFEAESDTYRRYRVRSAALVATYFPGMQAISQIMTAVIVAVGGARVAEGDLSVGVLVAFTMYLSQLYGPIQQLGQIFDSWQQATISFGRITELLDTRTTVPDTGTHPGAADAACGEITLDDVTFAYNPDSGEPPALRDLDVTLRAGETVALVGPTGAGKSTVVKLIARFYDPVRGTVRASGEDIARFPLAQWRRAVAQVPQETYLFPGTVAENIAYGVDSATDAEIEAAVARIGALPVIAAIPGGFNHPVGERGRGLSSGQRQIIALARAEMLEPDLLLLDEATATLDPATERDVLDATEQATAGRTSVIVAHRLATAARADRVLVIHKGRIMEDGSHEALLKRGGAYARMWSINR